MNAEPPDHHLSSHGDHHVGRQPTLFSAVLSFLSVIALIVFLFFVVGHFEWLGATTPGAADLKGTYVLAAPDGADKRASQFATAGYAVRFLDSDRVELRMQGGFRDGYYRVERDQVFIETAEAHGQNISLAFKIDGERLVGAGIVLLRQNR